MVGNARSLPTSRVYFQQRSHLSPRARSTLDNEGIAAGLSYSYS